MTTQADRALSAAKFREDKLAEAFAAIRLLLQHSAAVPGDIRERAQAVIDNPFKLTDS